MEALLNSTQIQQVCVICFRFSLAPVLLFSCILQSYVKDPTLQYCNFLLIENNIFLKKLREEKYPLWGCFFMRFSPFMRLFVFLPMDWVTLSFCVLKNFPFVYPASRSTRKSLSQRASLGVHSPLEERTRLDVWGFFPSDWGCRSAALRWWAGALAALLISFLPCCC